MGGTDELPGRKLTHGFLLFLPVLDISFSSFGWLLPSLLDPRRTPSLAEEVGWYRGTTWSFPLPPSSCRQSSWHLHPRPVVGARSEKRYRKYLVHPVEHRRLLPGQGGRPHKLYQGQWVCSRRRKQTSNAPGSQPDTRQRAKAPCTSYPPATRRTVPPPALVRIAAFQHVASNNYWKGVAFKECDRGTCTPAWPCFCSWSGSGGATEAEEGWAGGDEVPAALGCCCRQS